MLTADLVRITKKNGELKLMPFDAKRRKTAEDIASAYLDLFSSNIGTSREELEESVDAVKIDPRDRILAKGLQKLIEDRAEFDAESALDPEQVRTVVFGRAATWRRELAAEERFDRDSVLRSAAEELGSDPASVEAALFSDLRGAQILRSFTKISPAGLVAAYDTGRAQAVLLRAVRVKVNIVCTVAAGYRAVFRRMKFLRLLHQIEDCPEGYFIEIDGPMSLFESVTKYGLGLASLLPTLETCDRYSLEADVRWTPEETLSFKLEGGVRTGEKPSGSDSDSDSDSGSGSGSDSGSRGDLSEDAAALIERFRALDSGWTVEPAADILDLPGIGLCVPDLVFEREDPPARVHLEVMGHWSRDAVWRRVELVEAGLPTPVVFAVSTRLRVSERALDDESPSALYVYKGTMSARAVLEKIEAVAKRAK